MTTYDSTVGVRDDIAAPERTTGSRVKQAGQVVRNRPGIASAAALALAAVTATGVIGGRKVAQARRPRSRWQRLLDRIR
ncbi:hypothetical protein FHR83_009146 [Actinoplanes campanulatus]|uniref:Uncharacterized protein n=1 Tax=Actinoplanes campanulatus TaxID=113559 RepID=A0A7W5AS41_9ACTN|nr:hypothetical protein [Actinoplanes campanulatus]MBB3101223.1 hypothetical protein [Actinoplanes campanulatus]MBB3101417.1 hypothetical protein [Actinoplanes campanulatus]GID41970.1 hypothetical protein Aca09nite_84760 [Actinoplanes campanulatus]GID42521.1 hypothetical protein Aca09nite_90270 [Actinoplanes campanulatus]